MFTEVEGTSSGTILVETKHATEFKTKTSRRLFRHRDVNCGYGDADSHGGRHLVIEEFNDNCGRDL